MTRVVDAILIHNDRTDQAAELNQGMPVTPISCQPRHLEGEDCTNPAFANRRQQALKARPANAGSRTAKIVVNHNDVLPAQVSCTVSKTTLTAAALVIMHQLIRRRLTNVDIGPTTQVLRRYLRHRPPPRPLSPWKPRSALPEATAASGSSELAIEPSAVPPPRTDLLADGPTCASSCPFSVFESDRRKTRSASISMRRSRRCGNASSGSAQTTCRAAASCIIQHGTCVSVPSGWRTTNTSVPAKRCRFRISTF
jgi:hypothetical protein